VSEFNRWTKKSMDYDFMAIRVFHAGPTLILFAGAVLFAGINARRAKERSHALIFFGLLFLFIAMTSLQIVYAVVELRPGSVSDATIGVLMRCASWLPILSGACLLIGMIFLSQSKRSTTTANDLHTD